jgi:hypothetical protein
MKIHQAGIFLSQAKMDQPVKSCLLCLRLCIKG